MCTARLPIIWVSVATTKCQYQWGRGYIPCLVSRGGELYSEVQYITGNGNTGPPLPVQTLLSHNFICDE